MATYQGGIAGELAGSIGGNTFSRNASGPYVRAKVQPTNPMTPAQISARASFANGASLFSSSSASEIAEWNGFANTIFNPKSKTNVGQYTGYNAFISLFQAVQRANALTQTADFTVNGAAITSGVTQQPYFFQNNPNNIVPFGTGMLQAGTTTNVPLTLSSVSVDFANLVNLVLEVNSGIGTNLDNFSYEFESTLMPIGYVVYMSSPNNIPGLAYSNQELICLGAVQPAQAVDPVTDLVGVETIEVDWTSGISPIGYKNWPLIGQYVMCTVYALSVDGQFSLIGAQEVEYGV